MEMQNDHRNSQRSTQLGENPKHGHGIRAARNAQTDAVPRPDHGVPLYRFQYAFMEIFFHPANRGGGIAREAKFRPRPH
jgi:hypothetical protein